MKGVATLLLCVALFGLAGCGIQGKWTLQSVTPESARQDLRFGDITLKDDKTYEAVAKYDGKTETSTGKYVFDSANHKLTFTPDQKGQPVRTYDAQLIDMGERLKVETAYKGKIVTAYMKRMK